MDGADGIDSTYSEMNKQKARQERGFATREPFDTSNVRETRRGYSGAFSYRLLHLSSRSERSNIGNTGRASD